MDKRHTSQGKKSSMQVYIIVTGLEVRACWGILVIRVRVSESRLYMKFSKYIVFHFSHRVEVTISKIS